MRHTASGGDQGEGASSRARDRLGRATRRAFWVGVVLLLLASSGGMRIGLVGIEAPSGWNLIVAVTVGIVLLHRGG